MEKWTGDFIQRVIAAYSRALDKFLDRAWLTVPILLGCIIGLGFFFTHLPFTLLPVGDSGFARGVFIAQEGASPEQMRAFQKQVNEKVQAEPSVAQFFTNVGTGIDVAHCIAGNYLLRFQTARGTRSDRAMSVATAKIDQHDSGTDRGYLAAVRFCKSMSARRTKRRASTPTLLAGSFRKMFTRQPIK